MAFVNYSSREINVKIVYYGPGLSGKTANLKYLYARAPDTTKGRLISLATETERTLFFDFLPMNLGSLRGFQVRFHLYTVPGQVFYEASRKLILKGVDGVLFVADSDPLRLDANVEAYDGLQRNLREYGLSMPPLPLVLQYNKRDLPDVLPVSVIHEALGSPRVPQFEGVATTGTGVFDSLKSLARGVLESLQDGPSGIRPHSSSSSSGAGASVPSRPAANAAAAGGPAPSGNGGRPTAADGRRGSVSVSSPPEQRAAAEIPRPERPPPSPVRAPPEPAAAAPESETPAKRTFWWMRRLRGL